MAIAGDPSLRCRKCEARLSSPKHVDPIKYGLVPTKHGAIIRICKECHQLWLGFMQATPNGGQKIIMKMIDKEL